MTPMTDMPPANRMPVVPAIDKLYTTKEVASIFAVTAETVRGWINNGKLPGTQVGNKQYRVKRADLIAFAKSHYGVDV